MARRKRVESALKRQSLMELAQKRRAFAVYKQQVEAEVAQLRELRLGEYIAEIDHEVSVAYAAGALKTEIMEAYGTRDAGTISRILERTPTIENLPAEPEPEVEEEREAPDFVEDMFIEEDGSRFIAVDIDTHKAMVSYQVTPGTLDTNMRAGSYTFFTETPLFNSDYSVRNIAVDEFSNRPEYYSARTQALAEWLRLLDSRVERLRSIAGDVVDE